MSSGPTARILFSLYGVGRKPWAPRSAFTPSTASAYCQVPESRGRFSRRMSDALAAYRDTMRQRGEQARREQEARRRRARRTARRVADYLRRTYDADRVALFGSIADEEVPLSSRSDIDLAVWGLDSADYFEAVARVQDGAAPFQVDLVRIEQCPDSLREVIQREGREI